MARVWSFYFATQATKIATKDADGYTWELTCTTPGMLEIQTADPRPFLDRLIKFGITGLQRRDDSTVLAEDVNNPSVGQDGTITDGDGIITVKAPPEPTGV